jgi:glycerol-3-phosphate responsive antiterminator
MDERLRSKTKENILIHKEVCHLKDMIELAKESAKECGINLMDGAYAYWPLP